MLLLPSIPLFALHYAALLQRLAVKFDFLLPTGGFVGLQGIGGGPCEFGFLFHWWRRLIVKNNIKSLAYLRATPRTEPCPIIQLRSALGAILPVSTSDE